MQRLCAAPMQETIDQPLTMPAATGALVASAERAAEWAGEPFLHPDEDAGEVLATGTARRRALDDALAEIDSGLDRPTSEWKIRYALMLGLERVLSERPPKLLSGTELRRHQVDALAGMLTELIAAAQRQPEVVPDEPEDEYEDEEEEENGENGDGQRVPSSTPPVDELRPIGSRRDPPLPLPSSDRLGQDHRRRRVRRGSENGRRPHPHPPAPARLAVQP